MMDERDFADIKIQWIDIELRVATPNLRSLQGGKYWKKCLFSHIFTRQGDPLRNQEKGVFRGLRASKTLFS